jgi:hypothetical protein
MKCGLRQLITCPHMNMNHRGEALPARTGVAAFRVLVPKGKLSAVAKDP